MRCHLPAAVRDRHTGSNAFAVLPRRTQSTSTQSLDRRGIGNSVRFVKARLVRCQRTPRRREDTRTHKYGVWVRDRRARSSTSFSISSVWDSNTKNPCCAVRHQTERRCVVGPSPFREARLRSIVVGAVGAWVWIPDESVLEGAGLRSAHFAGQT